MQFVKSCTNRDRLPNNLEHSTETIFANMFIAYRLKPKNAQEYKPRQKREESHLRDKLTARYKKQEDEEYEYYTDRTLDLFEQEQNDNLNNLLPSDVISITMPKVDVIYHDSRYFSE